MVMTAAARVWLVAALLAGIPASAWPPAAQLPARADCREWRPCRQLALEAAARGEYETFHDLAWRAIQTGPPKDPELMYLLARAQCLSGRPHDALVMLRRLAEMGVAADVATNDDFRRTRELPGWPEVEVIINRVKDRTVNAEPALVLVTPPAPPAPRSTPAAIPPTAAAPTLSSPTGSSVPTRARVEEALRLSTASFAPGGLAYDRVSGRFIVGDLRARKLIVISEGSGHADDLVRAESAGFHNVMAIEIDLRRGELWVVSTVAKGGAGALHKLQLISGRLLDILQAPSELEPLRLTDVAVTQTGTVLVLDTAGRQVLSARPGAKTLELLTRIDDVVDPASLAPGGEQDLAYLAHRDGILRLDLKRRTGVPVTAPKDVDLRGFERIRWHRTSLVGVQRLIEGPPRVVRLGLNRTGRAVTRATVLDASIPAAAGPTFATLSGDELYYLVMTAEESSSPIGETLPREVGDLIVRRIRLQ